jgi:hypothetical protein
MGGSCGAMIGAGSDCACWARGFLAPLGREGCGVGVPGQNIDAWGSGIGSSWCRVGPARANEMAFCSFGRLRST